VRAREVAEERYSWEGIVRRHLEIYAGLTGLPAEAERALA
jgi:hypothetical protein